VSYPFGSERTKWSTWVALAASTICSSVASGFPNAMFSRIVPSNSQVSAAPCPRWQVAAAHLGDVVAVR
jgi:hypothetical protein